LAVDTICGSKIVALASIWANRRRGTGFRFAEIVFERNKYCFAHSLREFLLTAGGKHFALRKSHVQGFWLTAGAKGFRLSVAGRRTKNFVPHGVSKENEKYSKAASPNAPQGNE
jgi:hypothetical protein